MRAVFPHTAHRRSSGSDGIATLSGLPDGTDEVYVWKDGYQTGRGQLTVNAGAGSTTVTLEAGNVATASLTSQPMTLQQITAAGIDTSDPANQSVYQFSVQLAFPPGYGTGAPPELCGYVNGAGDFVGDTGFCGGGSGGGGSGGGGCSIDACYGPGVVAVSTIADGHPLIEWLILSGQATVLKQFFSVDMVINNLSAEPVELSNGTAALNIPAGLSLAPTSTPQSATQSVSTIAGMGSADVNWIVRGDTPGDYYLSATYTGTLQPFAAPITIQAALQNPLHVWGAGALALSVQADSGTLQPGQPYHVRLAITNNADVPFYNVGLSVDSTNHAHFIFQPDERFSDMIGQLDPGQTLYSHTYILVPDSASAGNFDPLQSSLTFAGQTGAPGSGITAVAPPKLYTLSTLPDTPGKVHLHWQTVPGATGYEVFSTPDLDTPFASSPDSVQSAQGASLTVLPGSATAAFIPVPQTGAQRYYAISSIVGGVLTLEHTVITGAAPPPSVGSDMSLTPGSGTVRTGQFVEVVATNVPDAAATVTFSITSGPNAGLVRPDNRPLVCDTNDFIANIVNAFKSGGRAAAGKVGSTGLATHTKSYQISTKLADAGYDLALELSDG